MSLLLLMWGSFQEEGKGRRRYPELQPNTAFETHLRIESRAVEDMGLSGLVRLESFHHLLPDLVWNAELRGLHCHRFAERVVDVCSCLHGQGNEDDYLLVSAAAIPLWLRLILADETGK